MLKVTFPLLLALVLATGPIHAQENGKAQDPTRPRMPAEWVACKKDKDCIFLREHCMTGTVNKAFVKDARKKLQDVSKAYNEECRTTQMAPKGLRCTDKGECAAEFEGEMPLEQYILNKAVKELKD